MDRIEHMAALLGKALGEGGKMRTARYKDSILTVWLQGERFSLEEGWWEMSNHTFLLMYEGELRIKASNDRLGFDVPVYVDFIPGVDWGNITMTGPFRACFVVIEQDFFITATSSMRNNIMEQMLQFSQSPFILPDADELQLLHNIEVVISGVLAGRSEGAFKRELLLSLVCSWQYELWEVFFHNRQATHADGTAHWKDAASHFFYLAHVHCREQHEVGWYAEKIGVSSDTLSAMLKRFYGKTAGVILGELLMTEAKICLCNKTLSVQDVAEMLCFSDQSSFGKFFKRHCGMSPNAFRKACE